MLIGDLLREAEQRFQLLNGLAAAASGGILDERDTQRRVSASREDINNGQPPVVGAAAADDVSMVESVRFPRDVTYLVGVFTDWQSPERLGLGPPMLGFTFAVGF